MSEQRVWIDPETWNLTGPDRNHRFSEGEADALLQQPPSCPGCGEDADLTFIVNRDLSGDSLQLTKWACYNDCESRRARR